MDAILVGLIVAAVLGLVPAHIAAIKGRRFLTWWLYGMVLFIAALPHVLMVKPDPKAVTGQRRHENCPVCQRFRKVIKPTS